MFFDYKAVLIGFQDAATNRLLFQAQKWDSSDFNLMPLMPPPEQGRPIAYASKLRNLQALSSVWLESKASSVVLAADTHGTVAVSNIYVVGKVRRACVCSPAGV